MIIRVLVYIYELEPDPKKIIYILIMSEYKKKNVLE